MQERMVRMAKYLKLLGERIGIFNPEKRLGKGRLFFVALRGWVELKGDKFDSFMRKNFLRIPS